MARFEIDPDKTVLLVIDMQNTWLRPGSPMETPSGRALIPNLNRLIKACREKGILIVFTRSAWRQDGSDMGLFLDFIPEMAARSNLIEGTADVEISDEMDCQERDIVILKKAYSAFYGTPLDLILHIKGIDTVIISGVVTWGCCESTARDARHRNYKVIFLSDGNAAYESIPDMGWGVVSADESLRHVLTVMAYRYAEVLSVEQVLSRLSES